MKADSRIDLSTLREGTTLTEMAREIVQENINLYAEASLDFNPIHTDEEFARNTPLGGTIAHGMLVLAYVWQMMNANFGLQWLSSGKLDVKFKNPTRPGDTVSISGKVLKIEKEQVSCDVLCQNQTGETIVIGNATFRTS